MLVACLAIAGCATAPPDLPLPRSGTARATVDHAACDAFVQDLARIDASMRAANAQIESERGKNQALTYFSGFVPPLILATEGNLAERNLIVSLYRERDQKVAAAVETGCQLPFR
jgi:hypothetical protein